MNPRVAKLRKESVETRPYISTERAELITEFYKSDIPARESVVVCRALSFKHLMEKKVICINDGELIVGERGPAPKSTPTYPELCCHDLEDLRIVNSREKTSFVVCDQVRETYKEKIIPFWSGKTLREKLFGAMSEKWHQAFDAGVFTEFMEQRAPGHAILDDKIYHKGMLDFKRPSARRAAHSPAISTGRRYSSLPATTASIRIQAGGSAPEQATLESLLLTGS